MHQEFDAHGLTGIWRHIHCLVNPLLIVHALMEDRLQDIARAISDVSVLPVKRDAVGGAVPVPEAQCAGTSGDDELLVEGAVP